MTWTPFSIQPQPEVLFLALVQFERHYTGGTIDRQPFIKSITSHCKREQ
jgi:hypothetical protein